MLGSGRGQPDPGDPRRGRRRTVQRVSGTEQRRRPRRPLRPAQDPAGRIRPRAQGDLVQRKPGALCAGHRAESLPSSSRRSASASAARSRWWAWRPKSGSWSSADEGGERAPVDMPMDVLLGKPPKMHRDVKRVQREFTAARSRPASACRTPRSRCWPSDGGVQALPHHHRRPHGGRPVAPRPDGRALAGAGGRLRRDAGRLHAASPARR